MSCSPGWAWGGGSSCSYIHLQIICKMKGLQAAGLVSVEQILTKREKKKTEVLGPVHVWGLDFA